MTGTAYDGCLDLEVRGHRWTKRQKPPLALTILERDSAPLLAMPTDCSGGQRGGDRVSVHVTVKAGGELEWRPPASALFFPSGTLGQECQLDQVIEVDAGASLLWIPKVSIPCSGSSVRQTTTLNVSTGADVLYWDGWTDGRTASGERSQFELLANRLELRVDDQLVYQERWVLRGDDGDGPAGFQGACQWFWGLACGTEAAQRLAAQVAVWQARGERAEYGVLADGVWMARALTRRPREGWFSERAPRGPAPE